MHRRKALSRKSARRFRPRSPTPPLGTSSSAAGWPRQPLTEVSDPAARRPTRPPIYSPLLRRQSVVSRIVPAGTRQKQTRSRDPTPKPSGSSRKRYAPGKQPPAKLLKPPMRRTRRRRGQTTSPTASSRSATSSGRQKAPNVRPAMRPERHASAPNNSDRRRPRRNSALRHFGRGSAITCGEAASAQPRIPKTRHVRTIGVEEELLL